MTAIASKIKEDLNNVPIELIKSPPKIIDKNPEALSGEQIELLRRIEEAFYQVIILSTYFYFEN